MNRTPRCNAITLWIAVWLLILLFTVQPLYAQTAPDDAGQPFVTITGIDASASPEISVTLYGENLGIDLAELPVTLREDTVERPIQNWSLLELGVQTAFALDASGDPGDNILEPGNSGRPRIEEVRIALETLIDNRNVLTPETDWAAAYTTSDNVDKFQIITDWTQDHGALRNDLLRYEPTADISPNTSLFELLTFVLDRFADSRVPQNKVKSIVVFSSGYDATSDLDITDAIDRARAMNVRIYTVMVGPEAPDRRSNLERIAQLTNGAYVVLQDPTADLDPLWEALRRQRHQLLLTYELGKLDPQELAITVTIPNGAPIVVRWDFPVMPVAPVEIRMLEPAPTNTAEPAPTPTLASTATALPPTPTLAALPTTEPSAMPALAAAQALGVRLLPFAPFALLALALLLFFRYRRRRANARRDHQSDLYRLHPIDQRAEPSARKSNLADEVTEIPAASPFRLEPAAYLIAINPMPHLPERIILHVGQVLRIGRRPDLNDVVLDDKQISRVHAIITHKTQGFYLQDNGSTGGTYVNRRKLSASDDKLLQPGDVINLYAIAYRFQLVEDERTEIPIDDPFTRERGRTRPAPPSRPTPTSAPQQDPDNTEYILYDDQIDDNQR